MLIVFSCDPLCSVEHIRISMISLLCLASFLINCASPQIYYPMVKCGKQDTYIFYKYNPRKVLNQT